MKDIPEDLDGATVSHYTVSTGSFGSVQTVGDREEIKYLAIASYPGTAEQVYLFGCSRDWIVVSDLLYESVDEAMSDAERFYETGPISWTKR